VAVRPGEQRCYVDPIEPTGLAQFDRVPNVRAGVDPGKFAAHGLSFALCLIAVDHGDLLGSGLLCAHDDRIPGVPGAKR